ncbi:MAG: hypothetical protein RID53_06760 [Coleofasciculus sp. B1-GNL1-01]
MSSPLIAMANHSLFLTVAQLKLSRGLDGFSFLHRKPHAIPVLRQAQ